MYEYDFNEDFGIDVDEPQQDSSWNMVALNVDLAIKKSALDDAKSNRSLACKDYVGYLSSINKASTELLEVYEKLLTVAKQILEGK